jgi:Domain of unknown function (DUF1905)
VYISQAVVYNTITMQFTFTAPLWLYSGKGSWHFVTLPIDAASEIKFFNAAAKGFMPIAVDVSINQTRWKTSLFPDSKSGSYLLPIKAAVRKAENLSVGTPVALTLNPSGDL